MRRGIATLTLCELCAKWQSVLRQPVEATNRSDELKRETASKLKITSALESNVLCGRLARFPTPEDLSLVGSLSSAVPRNRRCSKCHSISIFHSMIFFLDVYRETKASIGMSSSNDDGISSFFCLPDRFFSLPRSEIRQTRCTFSSTFLRSFLLFIPRPHQIIIELFSVFSHASASF